MARGWESKSVEDQIESAKTQAMDRKPAPFPANQIEILRHTKVLELSRARVARDLERIADPRYRTQLLRALEDLDAQLAKLKQAV